MPFRRSALSKKLFDLFVLHRRFCLVDQLYPSMPYSNFTVVVLLASFMHSLALFTVLTLHVLRSTMHHRKGASQPAMFLSLHDIAVSQNASSVWFASRWSMLKRSLVVSSPVASQMSTPVASTQDEPRDFGTGGRCLALVD